jgi:hypothetical protein
MKYYFNEKKKKIRKLKEEKSFIHWRYIKYNTQIMIYSSINFCRNDLDQCRDYETVFIIPGTIRKNKNCKGTKLKQK